MQTKLKVGLTAAGGRIGTKLRSVWEDKYEVTSFDYTLPDAQLACGPQIVKDSSLKAHNVDLADPKQLAGKFDGLDVVVHLAAWTNPTPEIHFDSINRNNIVATFNVLNECAKAKVKRVVFATTNHVQNGITMKGNTDSEIVDEDKIKKYAPLKLSDIPFPDSLYAVSKLFGEDLGKFYALHHGIEFIALRIGWYREINDPSIDIVGTQGERYMRAMYLSHDDCIGFFSAAVDLPFSFPTDNGIPWMAAYVCSNNDERIWDMTVSNKNLCYTPKDNSATYFKKSNL